MIIKTSVAFKYLFCKKRIVVNQINGASKQYYGAGVAERSKATGSRPVVPRGRVGSNPTPGACYLGPSSSLVGCEAWALVVRGSNPRGPTKILKSLLA